MKTGEVLVEVVRNEMVESVHAGHLLVLDASGKTILQLGDVDSLVETAKKILKNSKLAISMGRNAREGVKIKFCIPDISTQISDLYKQAIENK